MRKACWVFFGLLVISGGCLLQRKNLALLPAVKVVRTLTADHECTRETAALFYNLQQGAKKHVLFGHMEDNKNGYDGIKGWVNAPNRSDVYETAGVYPEVYGFDLGGIASLNTRPNSNEAKIAHERIIEAYKRNGVITFSWHYGNPVSKGSFNWKDSPVNAVSAILPGGNYHKDYTASLEKIAAFARSLKYKGRLAPVIFRPFHELDGDWFWWGKAHCTAADYKALYRFTVTFLRDSLQVHNFLYAFSPDRNFTSESQYLERYPGSDYVDILGMDNYWDLRVGQQPQIAADKLKIIAGLAAAQNKISAFTETGLENLPQADWYTQMLLKSLKMANTNIAYVMAWSNRPRSFWTPYKGHPAEIDFKLFLSDPYIGTAANTPRLYKIK